MIVSNALHIREVLAISQIKDAGTKGTHLGSVHVCSCEYICVCQRSKPIVIWRCSNKSWAGERASDEFSLRCLFSRPGYARILYYCRYFEVVERYMCAYTHVEKISTIERRRKKDSQEVACSQVRNGDRFLSCRDISPPWMCIANRSRSARNDRDRVMRDMKKLIQSNALKIFKINNNIISVHFLNQLNTFSFY